MLIYFTASLFQKKQFGENYTLIIQTLLDMGHNVIHEHISGVSLEDRRELDHNKRRSYSKQVINWIQKADLIVAELSYPSSVSVGFEVTKALEKNKPVLGLYHQGQNSVVLDGFQSDRFLYEEYTRETLKSILQQAVQYALNQTDTRFNFFISPKQVMFLEYISRKRKIPKSVFLRELIERDKQQNPPFSDE